LRQFSVVAYMVLSIIFRRSHAGGKALEIGLITSFQSWIFVRPGRVNVLLTAALQNRPCQLRRGDEEDRLVWLWISFIRLTESVSYFIFAFRSNKLERKTQNGIWEINEIKMLWLINSCLLRRVRLFYKVIKTDSDHLNNQMSVDTLANKSWQNPKWRWVY
jgi:hypothetical protein